MISKIIPGGAADKEGSLKEGDRIISVGQNDGGNEAGCIISLCNGMCEQRFDALQRDTRHDTSFAMSERRVHA